jgi:hypothetical protein
LSNTYWANYFVFYLSKFKRTMRSTLSKRYKMCLSIRNVLSNYETVIDTVPVLKSRVTDFYTQLGVLDAGTMVGVEGTAGFTESKNQLRERLGMACFSLANAIWSHASDLNNEILKARVPVTMSAYMYGKEVDLIGRFRAVMQEANGLKKELAQHGFPTTVLETIQKDADEFSLTMNAPKDARDNNSSKLKSFVEDFKAMDTVLEKLDRSVNAMMFTQQTFHQDYQKSRYIGSANPKKEKDIATPVERQKALLASLKPTPEPILPTVKTIATT